MDVSINEEGEIGIDLDHSMIVVNYKCQRVKRSIKLKCKPKCRLKCADWKMFSDKINKVDYLTSLEQKV